MRDCGAALGDRLAPPHGFSGGGAPGETRIQHGKTESARRRIPLLKGPEAILDIRRETFARQWVFPTGARSGQIETASVKRQNIRACREASVEQFPLYTLRHACLTRWARNLGPLDAGVPGRPSRHGDHAPLRSPAGRNHPGSIGAGNGD